MRFVAAKSEEQQAAAMVFRVRDLMVRQRTQTINAIRGHLAEFGLVAAQGLFHAARLVAAIEDEDNAVPEAARPILSLLVAQLRSLGEKVAVLDREIARRAREDAEARRLMTIPGIGPITATTVAALAPSATTFKSLFENWARRGFRYRSEYDSHLGCGHASSEAGWPGSPERPSDIRLI